MRRFCILLALIWCVPLWADLTLSNCDDPKEWNGVSLETTQVHEGKGAIRWEFGQAGGISLRRAPRDWSAYNALSFWLYCPQADGSRVYLIFSSEDPTQEGSDYYMGTLKLSFTGWQQVTIPLAELGKARSPRGWDKIDGFSLSSTWDPAVKPNPRTVVILDDVRLVNTPADQKGPRLSDEAFFGMLDLSLPALADVKAAVAKQDWAAARHAYAEYYRHRDKPRWLTTYRDRPAQKQASYNTASADALARHEFTFIGTTYKPTGRIDWSHNAMTEGESATIEWNAQFNRHFVYKTLVDAYWATGQEKYAQELVSQWLAWIEDCPVLLWQSGNGPYHHAWETLNTGIRLGDTWPNALYRCLTSPAFTDDAIVTILKSMVEHTQHLIKWPSTGNWLTSESMGVFNFGLMNPEFKAAAEWRQIAIGRLYNQLDHEVYPDGLQYELALGYNNWVVSEFSQVLKLAKLNEQMDLIPADYLKQLEKMYNYQLYAAMPTGIVAGFNDSGDSKPTTLLQDAALYFPQRQDFLWGASQGTKGVKPAPDSVAFSYIGHYALRTGWGDQDLGLYFDAGPFGAGHQHEDKLHFVLFAYGRKLLLEAGVTMYDKSRFRRYELSTRGHNTIRVDGQEQRRRFVRSTNVSPYPFQPLPNPFWTSSQGDFVEGTYEEGYGEKKIVAPVTHRRSILFIKPDYWIVTDALTPADSKSHRYESIYHLNSETTSNDNLRVATTNSDANLTLFPASQEGLSVEVVKGIMEEPIQGWANAKRPFPTALYHWEATGPTRTSVVLYPTAGKQTCPLVKVESLPVTDDKGQPAQATAAALTFADGSRHVYLCADPGAGLCHFDRYQSDGRCAWIALDAKGKTVRTLLYGGTVLR